MAAGQATDPSSFRGRIEARLAAGERLARADGLDLFGCDDLSWLGGLAHQRRTAAVGDRAGFVPGGGSVAAGAAEVEPGETTGLPTGCVALPYGPGAAAAELVDAALEVRTRVDDGDPVWACVPVRQAGEPPVSPAESMKLFAVCRLLLDNVAELAGDLGSHEPSTAQLLLHFGASVLLTPVGEPAGRDETVAELVDLIGDAGFTPVELDADGAEVRRYDPAPSQAERRAAPQSVFS